ncbi:MAG: prepilin-type N-terminal cleavage/methylation domain-containing protein [Verrucomicrobiia bacterium]
MRRGCPGFSLLEIVVVLAIGALLLGLAAHHALPRPEQLAPETTARLFGCLVEEASRLARDTRSPVRIVFLPRSLTAHPPASGEADTYTECLLYRFVIPPAARREVLWRLPGDGHAVRGGDALERIPVTVPGLPECLVGQWQRVARKPFRLSGPGQQPIGVHSELFERFDRQSPEEFAAENGWTPPNRWRQGPPGPWDGYGPSSPFPETYHLTPFPDGPPLVHRPLPAQALLFDAQARALRPVSDFWDPSSPQPHFDLTAHRTPNQHLPYLEFDARGQLQARWARPVQFSFTFPNRPDKPTRIHLDPSSGLARLALMSP